MARLFAVVACFSVLVALVVAQDFDFFGGYQSFNAAPRDPRQNRGPVTFPSGAPASLETSGVRVGASGYGFVPPGARGGIGPHGAGPNVFSGFHFW
ncbi:uncharacterized protein LOC106669475 isoform X2 [Cimex lectularius]|uniref:CPR type cuticle protein n=1 Tax=Cimex lectularius TaxID=79782 RepID=A0A8I6S1Z3_CIMLE|nr:uncharacterized protein LOC106669475 isoform X2 [Cimex lectularius]